MWSTLPFAARVSYRVCVSCNARYPAVARGGGPSWPCMWSRTEVEGDVSGGRPAGVADSIRTPRRETRLGSRGVLCEPDRVGLVGRYSPPGMPTPIWYPNTATTRPTHPASPPTARGVGSMFTRRSIIIPKARGRRRRVQQAARPRHGRTGGEPADPGRAPQRGHGGGYGSEALGVAGLTPRGAGHRRRRRIRLPLRQQRGGGAAAGGGRRASPSAIARARRRWCSYSRLLLDGIRYSPLDAEQFSEFGIGTGFDPSVPHRSAEAGSVESVFEQPRQVAAEAGRCSSTRAGTRPSR